MKVVRTVLRGGRKPYLKLPPLPDGLRLNVWGYVLQFVGETNLLEFGDIFAVS